MQQHTRVTLPSRTRRNSSPYHLWRHRRGIEWADGVQYTPNDELLLFSEPMHHISKRYLPPLYRALDDATVGKVLGCEDITAGERHKYWPEDFDISGNTRLSRPNRGHAYKGPMRFYDAQHTKPIYLGGGEIPALPGPSEPYLHKSGGKLMDDIPSKQFSHPLQGSYEEIGPVVIAWGTDAATKAVTQSHSALGEFCSLIRTLKITFIHEMKHQPGKGTQLQSCRKEIMQMEKSLEELENWRVESYPNLDKLLEELHPAHAAKKIEFAATLYSLRMDQLRNEVVALRKKMDKIITE